MTEEQMKKLLSAQTHKRLTKLIEVCDMSFTATDITNNYTKLREYLGNFVSYYSISHLPNDVLNEFAETLHSLYYEKSNLPEYCQSIRHYLHNRLEAYRKEFDNVQRQFFLVSKKVSPTSMEYIDAKYVYWLYTHGYYAGRADMYQLQIQILEQLEYYAKG